MAQYLDWDRLGQDGQEDAPEERSGAGRRPLGEEVAYGLIGLQAASYDHSLEDGRYVMDSTDARAVRESCLGFMRDVKAMQGADGRIWDERGEKSLSLLKGFALDLDCLDVRMLDGSPAARSGDPEKPVSEENRLVLFGHEIRHGFDAYETVKELGYYLEPDHMAYLHAGLDHAPVEEQAGKMMFYKQADENTLGAAKECVLAAGGSAEAFEESSYRYGLAFQYAGAPAAGAQAGSASQGLDGIYDRDTESLAYTSEMDADPEDYVLAAAIGAGAPPGGDVPDRDIMARFIGLLATAQDGYTEDLDAIAYECERFVKSVKGIAQGEAVDAYTKDMDGDERNMFRTWFEDAGGQWPDAYGGNPSVQAVVRLSDNLSKLQMNDYINEKAQGHEHMGTGLSEDGKAAYVFGHRVALDDGGIEAEQFIQSFMDQAEDTVIQDNVERLMDIGTQARVDATLFREAVPDHDPAEHEALRDAADRIGEWSAV